MTGAPNWGAMGGPSVRNAVDLLRAALDVVVSLGEDDPTLRRLLREGEARLLETVQPAFDAGSRAGVLAVSGAGWEPDPPSLATRSQE